MGAGSPDLFPLHSVWVYESRSINNLLQVPAGVSLVSPCKHCKETIALLCGGFLEQKQAPWGGGTRGGGSAKNCQTHQCRQYSVRVSRVGSHAKMSGSKSSGEELCGVFLFSFSFSFFLSPTHPNEGLMV
jgi:hypothetical protein